MHQDRQKKLRNEFSKRQFDGFLVTDIDNIFYLTGFTGSTAAAIITHEEAFILVDPRYSIQARAECVGTKVVDYTSKPTITAAAELVNELKLSVLGFEADNMTVALKNILRRQLNKSTRLRPTQGIIQKLRRIKDANEISLIKHAIKLTDKTFTEIISQIRPGMSEKELALAIDSTMRRLGADKEGFETIAASGPNSACPHASPTDRVIKKGDFVKMDYGARYKNYNSDITRTICVGTPTDKQKEIYQIVLDSQLLAIDSIAPGKSGREIDSIAREYIASKGYGDNFGHGLGHALGIQVHDGPGFSKTSDIILEPGMVITVEPGIYIEGLGGVRIEDDILVTKNGVEILTAATKEMICI